MKASLNILMIICLFYSTSSFAKDLSVVEISRDDADLVYKLVIDSGDEVKIDQVRKETYQKGVLVNNEILDQSQLAKGIVLEEQKGFKALILRSANFDNYQGGEVEVDTLFSGITGERKSAYFDLTKHATGWALFSGSIHVKKLEIKVNKSPLLGVIGIKELVINPTIKSEANIAQL